MATTTGMDAEREFWIGLRNTYVQQIRLIRSKFTGSLVDPDGALVAGVVMGIEAAVAAIEKRYDLRARGADPK